MNVRFLLAAFIFSSYSAGNVSAGNPFPLKQFKSTQITSGDMKKFEKMDISYIHSLKADNLLYFFRERANLPQPEGAASYGGWESTDLRGHTLGHYLTALSILYVQSGDSKTKSTINHVVKTLDEIQNATGKGYVSAFSESMLDRVEADGSGWAPYYTLHKILQGLIDAHVYAGNELALTVADKFGDYIYDRTTRLTDQAHWERVLDIMEVGGFAEAMLNLYQLTDKEKHLQAGQFFQQMTKLRPASEGLDILADNRTSNFNHSNSTIPQFIAAVREYELTGDKVMLDAARHFWNHVVEHRAYCNGSTSFWEHWNLPPDHLSQELGVRSGETCCTYNLIRLSNDLFRLLRNPKYAEYVERATLNHIMGTIHPESGNFMYFHTQKPGTFKWYGNNDQVFWCCTGTGMENHLRYAHSVFFNLQDTLYVTQYFPTQLHWEEKGLKLEQITEFPYQESTRLKITEGAANATLKIRIPTWTNDFAVKVNGRTAKGKVENGFCCISRNWNAGDVIKVTFPMKLRLEPMADHHRMAAIFYGPLVLAGDLGSEGVTSDRVNINDNFYNGHPNYMNPTTPVPTLTGSMEKLNWLKKKKNKLEFTTTATSDGSTLRLIPLYKATGIRFTDYWEFPGETTK